LQHSRCRRIAGERIKTLAVLKVPMVLLESARAPVAVLFVPLSLTSRAAKTHGSVEKADCVALKR